VVNGEPQPSLLTLESKSNALRFPAEEYTSSALGL
jgi:hypothetical protein